MPHSVVVFMWVPSMLLLTENLPTGLVFSCFMLSMTAGGMIFGVVSELFPNSSMFLCCFVYLVSALSMVIPVYYFHFWSVFVAFLVLEAMVGMFFSVGAALRSVFYPEGSQASIISVFRFPLNALVVTGTLLTDKASDVNSLQRVFCVLVGMLSVALVLQICLFFIHRRKRASTSTKIVQVQTKKKQ